MAIAEAEKLGIRESSQYYELLGYLYAQSDKIKAIQYYEAAIKHTKSNTKKATLKREIERLQKIIW